MTTRKKVLIALGTRPEAIKLAPVIKALENNENLVPIVVATAQHRDLMDQVLQLFKITPQVDLNLMKSNQDLFYTTSHCLERMEQVLKTESPSMVIVQGDTATAFTAALAAYYSKIPIAHIEAGLRTDDIYAPFPEEGYRKLIGALAELHFAPTEQARVNLLKENINPDKILLTGNTSIDALKMGIQQADVLPPENLTLEENDPTILLTLHRRENFGNPLAQIFSAISTFAYRHPKFQIVYPVHPNPNVLNLAKQYLSSFSNIHLIPPTQYSEMLFLLGRAQFVLTDSGGIQEEAPSLGKPTLILRNRTERMEAVQEGAARLVGNNPELIYQMMLSLSDTSSELYQSMAHPITAFGDGKASQKIIDRISTYFTKHNREGISCAASSDI